MNLTTKIVQVYSWVDLLVFISITISSVHSSSISSCLTLIEKGETTGYFFYCNQANKMTRDSDILNFGCNDDDRLKVMNFKAFVPKNRNYKKCSRTLNKLRYKNKVNTTCLPDSERNEIILPFLGNLSGKKVKDIEEIESDIPSSRFGYRQIALETTCEAESAPKMDICKPGFKVFHENVNVSLEFKVETFHQNLNHSSCFCYFKTFNTSRRISVRALDIRLHPHNQLMLDSHTLSSNRLYWWQSGVLHKGLRKLKLSGLSMETLPHSIWIDIYGMNVNITCDNKELSVKEEEIVTGSKEKYSSSSSGGLDMVYILIAVIGAIVGLIIVAIVIKFCQSRISRPPRSGVYKVEDPDSSEMFLSTFENGERPHSPNDSIADMPSLYSKSQKSKNSGNGQNNKFFELKASSDDEEDNNMNASMDSSEHQISHDADVHDFPKEVDKRDSDGNEYNHFFERPDVVPSTNIYNTTDAGIYSSLQKKDFQRQQSKPENIYDG